MNILNLVAASQGQAGLIPQLLSMAPIFIIMFLFIFIMTRSQRKKTKERQKMLDAIRAGDKIITIGGLIGTIVSIKDKIIILRIAESTQVEITRSSVSAVMEKQN